MNPEETLNLQKQIFIWSKQSNIQNILEIMYSRFISTFQELNYESNIDDDILYYKFISLIYHLNIIK
jgi:hypothetical protein